MSINLHKGGNLIIKNAQFMVIMTDSFMSGWGGAVNKISKYVICCENEKQAKLIRKNANLRKEMSKILIVEEFPKRFYNKDNYVVSVSRFKEVGDVWKREVDHD